MGEKMNWKKERKNHIYAVARRVNKNYSVLYELTPKKKKEIFDKLKNQNYYYRNLI
tara:strand:+ start:929 stop:1096 length:168 start_codon:yes stop_codon:yes gene_type:complete